MSIVRRVANGASAFVIACSSLMTLAFPLTAHAAAQVCTWTGVTDTLFSTATNWAADCGGGVPLVGDTIRFDNKDVAAIPADGIAPIVLTNDLNVAFGGVETYFSTPGTNTVYIDALKFADGGYFEATAAPAQTNMHLDISVGHVPSGQTSVTYGDVTGLGSLNIKTSGLNYGKLDVVGSLTAGDGVNVSRATLNGTLTLLNGSRFYLYLTDETKDLTYSIVVGGGSGTEAPIIDVEGNYQTYDSTTKLWTDKNSVVTFSGNVTLSSDLDVTANYNNPLQTVKFTGTVSGTGKITRNKYSVGRLIIPSGELTNPVTTSSLDGDIISGGGYVPGASVTIVQNETATLNGKRSYVQVNPGGILKGTGTVTGQTDVTAGGTVAPGNSPGCLTSDTLALAGTYLFELGGTDPCTGYDQLKVLNALNAADAVTLDAATATLTTSLYNSYAPKKGQVFIIIDQAGDKAVTGTFKGLAEGATFEQNGIVFKISYVGGTGNDVTLTVQSVPAVPDTGFSFVSAQPAIILAIMTVLSGAIVFTARRMNAFKR